MVTLHYRTLVAFLAGVTLTIVSAVAFTAWRVDAAPGDDDATFVPITPCRLADTRPAPDRVGVQGTFSADDTKTFDARGTNGDCTIPADAVGLSLNVTALKATLPTFLTIWPDGPRPTASSLNPSPGQPPVPNAVTTTLASDGSFRVYNLQGRVEVIIDVNGYYTQTGLQELASRLAAAEATINSHTGAIAGLEAAQPFTVASEPINYVTAGSTVTEIRRVIVKAPVAGHVAVIASGYMAEFTDGHGIQCGLMDSVTEPGTGVELRWDSPTGSDYAHLSASRVFDIADKRTATYSLVCLNRNGGLSDIWSPQVTAIFTPAP